MARKGSLKRKHSVFIKEITRSSSEQIPWLEEFTPSSVEDLAVHKKKVSEVQTWFQNFFSSSGGKKVSPILILTGPPGVGKTATIKAVCNTIDAELFVWSNTHQEKAWISSDVDFFTPRDTSVEKENQTLAFSRFLLHSAKYSLFSNLKRTILIEEFPNALVRNPEEFHSIIRKYSFNGKFPAVFIISDNAKGDSAENRLFPKDLQISLNITNISFNPVAPTMLMKILTRINMSSKVDSIYSRLNKAQLEGIASDSKGDIRNAINTMQFLCMTQSASLHKEDHASTNEKSKECVLKRDSSLFLFHALGKILYCKRDPTLKSEKDLLPTHLKHLERVPLIENAEEVYEKTSISAEGFNLFLQENYLPFIEDIKVATECAKWLSDADALSAYWSGRETLNDYAVSIATRGLMFNLVPTNFGRRWRSLHKPQFYENNSKKNHLTYSLKQSFKGTSLSLKELQIDFIPFISRMQSKQFTLGQIALAKEIGEMNIKRFISPSFKPLDEKDIFTVESDVIDCEVESATDPTQENDVADIEMPDEEIIIEEYDF